MSDRKDSNVSVRKSIFLAAAHFLRAMPDVRGKVRIGLALYRLLHRPGDRWHVEVPLFRGTTRFELTLESAHERMALLMDGYEVATSSFLADLYDAGSILDIGANIGLIAIPLAKRVKDRGGRIFAFEPVPSNFQALVRNIERNQVTGVVTPFHLGLGETEKTAYIEVEPASKGATGTANILPDHFEFERLAVDVRSIDSLMAEGKVASDVRLVKIDTDGYDLFVLRGSRKLLQQQRPIIYAELNDFCLGWHGQSIDDAIRFLHEYEYELFPQIHGRRSMKFSREFAAGFNSDALLVPTEKLSTVQKYLLDS